ncbi:DNA-directed RNA polymerase subunit beta [Gracilibacillus caseinilyticus]|uniref:DNA-directed RNA polymerase subunit beta n=1 Tax=Gracilibacillus caseinilyticus TaxID=2932256 RepID=A0ABY4F1B3_9BACI|nr:DNA-directed RNA polymerase subunit beta [Gracilibacillus caseinilyticus]UOQ50269.1 DNA-directed RNA polymerase subunit beta [Gracilibacillus caseinilyticus]
MSEEIKNEMKTPESNQEKKQKNEKRAEVKEKQKQEELQEKEKRYVRRLIPIWAKLLIFLVLSSFALLIGLIVGFSILGDGSPLDVLKWETWQHIIDFIQK